MAINPAPIRTAPTYSELTALGQATQHLIAKDTRRLAEAKEIAYKGGPHHDTTLVRVCLRQRQSRKCGTGWLKLIWRSRCRTGQVREESKQGR